ncbi:MAG: hypothetical protein V3V08_25720 [Nannocystaceae bacterium]
MRLSASTILLLPIAAIAAGCAHAKQATECTRRSRAQCVFVQAQTQAQAQAQARPDARTPSGAIAATSANAGWQAEPGWDDVDEILGYGITYLGSGAGAIDVAADRWCAETPTPHESDSGEVWVCALRQAPRLGGHELTLEFDRYGLFSLTGFGYSREEGRELIRASLTRWSQWCTARRFEELESIGADAFHRCALSEGPFLVVGRFTRDLDDDLWQVSLAIIGAG